MGKPRFRPASICANPRDFGRKKQPEWRANSGLSQREVAWAIYQHRAALALRHALVSERRSLGDLAKSLGEEESWLQRKLHGQAPADLGDILAWTLELGIDVLPVPDSSHDLVPAGLVLRTA